MPDRRTIPLVPALAAFAVVLAAGTVVVYGLVNARRQQAARAAGLEVENRALRDRLARLGTQAGSSRAAAGPSGAPRPAWPPQRPGEAAALDQTRMLIDLREKLAASSAAADKLQARVAELDAALGAARNENARLAASEAGLRDQLMSAGTALASAQADAKSNSEKVARLEADNVRLREENRAAVAKASAAPAVLKDLDDLDRRREALLAGILRRYKDVTDQYRALAEGAGGAGLGRIHNIISLAEEDLRQLTTLDSQAARLRSRIGAK
jgi:regulator of replication initiation timing